jgi:hypothetical protein
LFSNEFRNKRAGTVGRFFLREEVGKNSFSSSSFTIVVFLTLMDFLGHGDLEPV